jgi:uncharacterized protein
MKQQIEHRAFKAEIRSTRGAANPQLTGYAALFNTVTDLGSFREQIAPAAFDRALREKHDVRFLMNHDPSLVLGRSKSGTLALSRDTKGLKFACDAPTTQLGRDVHTLVERGDLDQMSFGFIVTDESHSCDADGRCLRTIKDVDLKDISVVTYPAYEGTSCEARSIAEFAAGLRTAKRAAPSCPGDRDYYMKLTYLAGLE